MYLGSILDPISVVCGLLLADSGIMCVCRLDLHPKRMGHKDFTEKTVEVAKPMDLEASLNPDSSLEAMDVDTTASASEKPQGWVIQQCTTICEMSKMGLAGHGLRPGKTFMECYL